MTKTRVVGCLSSTLSRLLLVLSGLAIAGQGVFPADMTNGVADITSPYTRGHFMKRSAQWRGLRLISIVLVLLALVASFALRGALPDGLAQRLGNAIFFLWFVLMSLRLSERWSAAPLR